MRIVSVTYRSSPDVHRPEVWMDRIRIYTGSWALLANSHEIIRVEQIDYEGREKHEGIDYHFVRFGKGKHYIPWGLHRYISLLKPDVMVVAGLHYPLQVIQLRLQIPRHAKIICQHHAEMPFTGIKKYWQQWADRFIDAYLFSSLALGNTWVSRGNIRSVSKIHEVMEVSSLFYPADKKKAKQRTGALGEPVFLWVGRLDRNKDPLTVLKAFLGFLKINPSAKLYMIYQTEELLPEIQEILAREKSGSIVLVGRVPHNDLLDWYNSADFIVSGSHYEGSGTAICEAMSCGCIPVLPAIDAFIAMTRQGDCGILYEMGNVDSLLQALTTVLNQNMEQMRADTLKQFQNSLSFEAIAAKIQSLLATFR